MRQSSGGSLSRSKKKALLESLDELTERMPSLLNVDHPCAQKQIADARHVVQVCMVYQLFIYNHYCHPQLFCQNICLDIDFLIHYYSQFLRMMTNFKHHIFASCLQIQGLVLRQM